jgi:chemotaxis family two-component system response regulator Rcp1
MDMMKSAVILLIEDNPADIRLTQEALKDNKLAVNLHIVNDGAEAMEFLSKKKKYADAPTPDLILLDLNMPKKDGREVLKEIKRAPALQTIPVIILTTSQSEEDILLTYKYHANCYIRKPLDLIKFIEVIKEIESFWLTIVTLPPKT